VNILGRAVLIAALALPSIASAQKSVQYNGWDPGLDHRRAATHTVNNTYFESCPDDASGCLYNIPSGGGFWTLSPDFGAYGTMCKINSAAYFSVGGLYEICPYYFSWTTQGASLAASTTIDTSGWNVEDDHNNYFGFQENMPWGVEYLGGQNPMFIDNAHEQITIDTTVTLFHSLANARFLVGTAWYDPVNDRSYVIELNLDAVGALSGIPEWTTTSEAVQNLNCLPIVCLYLGGRYWSMPRVFNRGATTIKINWTAIVSQLILDRMLPQSAMGHHQIAVTHSGPEVHGRVKVTTLISGFTTWHTSELRCLACRGRTTPNPVVPAPVRIGRHPQSGVVVITNVDEEDR
jgi:hypothetical protein